MECSFRNPAIRIVPEISIAKRIYWSLITKGDTLSYSEIAKLFTPEDKRVLDLSDGKLKAIKSFIGKYSNLFEITRDHEKGFHLVRPVVKIEFCKTFDSKQGCLVKNCRQLHVCRHFVKGKCTFGSKCKKPHKFDSTTTRQILQEHCLEGLSDYELKEFLCRNVQFALDDVVDASNVPKQLEICKYYNVAIGCSRENQCPFLHVCRFYAEEGTCKFGTKCIRKHDLANKHSQSLLARYGMPEETVWLYLRVKADDNKNGIIENSSLHKANGNTDLYPPMSLDVLTKQRAQSFDGALGDLSNQKLLRVPMRKYSDSVSLEEICEDALDGTCQNASICRRLHRALPFSWEYSITGNSWNEISPQENIKVEAAFSDVNQTECAVVLNMNENVIFKFCHWLAVPKNGYSFFAAPNILKIRRLSTASAATKKQMSSNATYLTNWVWYYSDGCGNWRCYGSRDKYNRSVGSVSNDAIEIAYQHPGRNCLPFKREDKDYFIDFYRMVEEEVCSGLQREVRRRPSGAKSMQKRNVTKPHEKLSQEKFYFPSYWCTSCVIGIGIPGQEFEILDLIQHSKEYQNVSQNFSRTMDGFIVNRIFAVQNPRLWMEYAMKRENIKETDPSAVVEKYLYRSASSKDVEEICKHGFHFDLSDTEQMKLQDAPSFVSEARLALGEDDVPMNGTRLMFFCRVIISSCVTEELCKDNICSKTKTNSSDTIDPSIYYAVEYDMVFPEFLIQYHASCF